MLRYKVYALVTHPSFPKYSYRASWILYFAAIYVLLNPELIEQRAFVSENALNMQTSNLNLKELSSFNVIDNFEDYILNKIQAKK